MQCEQTNAVKNDNIYSVAYLKFKKEARRSSDLPREAEAFLLTGT